MPVRHFLRNDYLHVLIDIKFLVFVCLALQISIESPGKPYLSGKFPFSPIVDLDSQKKEILPYPRCGFGACLRCGQAF